MFKFYWEMYGELKIFFEKFWQKCSEIFLFLKFGKIGRKTFPKKEIIRKADY